jgi:hypothetical protein
VGPAITRVDNGHLPREKPLRGRDYFSIFGTFKVARTCDRTPGEPGIFPLDAQVNLPERCDSYVLQEWMTVFEVEPPFQERASWFAQLFDLDAAESVLMEVAKEAPQDYESFYTQRPVPPEDTEGALLVVSVDGKGFPMIKEEAVKLKAKLGTGEKRQLRKSVRQTLAKVITFLHNHRRWMPYDAYLAAGGGAAPGSHRRASLPRLFVRLAGGTQLASRTAGVARGVPAGGHGRDCRRRGAGLL